MRGNGGRAEVDGEAVDGRLVETGVDVDQRVIFAVVVLVQRDGGFPAALAQNGLEFAHDGERGHDAFDLPLVLQRGAQTLQIARRLVHVGFLHLDVIELRCGVHDDVALGRGLTDDLTVHLALGRNVDDDVRLDGRLTAQTAALGQAAHTVVTFFDRVPFGQRVVGDMNAVFGEFAVGGRNLALGTNAASATNAIKVDAKLARSSQDGSANGKTPPFAGGREDHKGIGRHRGIPVRLTLDNAKRGSTSSVLPSSFERYAALHKV